MDLFDSNFIEIRNNHIIPKIGFGIARKKIGYWSFKDVITNKLVSLKKLTGKTIEIEIKAEDYYKAIHCDVELFLNKSIIQYSDISILSQTSRTWSFVSIYYFAFFNVTCLFRFLDKGFLFFSREHCKRLEDFSLAMYSDIIALNSGNYYCSLKEVNSYGNAVLIISNKNDSVHKSTWQQLELTLKEFSNNANNEEKIVCDLFLKHFLKFKSEYPSQLRNKLNYNGLSSILDFENAIPVMKLINVDREFLKKLIKVDSESSEYSEKMTSVTLLASYLYELNSKLHLEYLERSGYGKDFKKERTAYLKYRNVV